MKLALPKLIKAFVLCGLATVSLLGAKPKGVRRKAKRPVSKVQVKKNRTSRPASADILNLTALKPFYEKLRKLEKPQGEDQMQRVRILHFGDSHTAADYWTGRLRKRLQARFGDGGPGLVQPGKPWRGYTHAGWRMITGYSWPANGLRSAECDGWVGLAGTRVEAPAGENLQIQATFSRFEVHGLGKTDDVLRYRLAPLPEPIPGETSKVEIPLIFSEFQPLSRLAQTPLGPKNLHVFGSQKHEQRRWHLEVQFPEGFQFMGLDLSSAASGVIYDELGLNGAELQHLEGWNPELAQALLDAARPDLIVLAYGTNEMGKSLDKLCDHRERIKAVVQRLQKITGAPILLVGPFDRTSRKPKARAALLSGAAKVIENMKAVSLETGCAFWDARAAMGGPGAIQQWRKKGHAQKDLVHLTGPGYERLGDAFYAALMAGF